MKRNRPDLPARVYEKHNALYFVDKDGKWHRLCAGVSFSAVAAKRYGEIVEGHSKLMAGLFDEYEKQIVPGKARSTQATNRAELGNLRYAFGQMHPNQVKPDHIYAYLKARGAPIRAKREVALLSHVFNYGIAVGRATDNPCRLVKPSLLGNAFAEKARTRYVTDTEFWAVHSMVPESMQRGMIISVATGIRLGDLLRLTRRDKKDEGLFVATAKTGVNLLFPWTPQLREACTTDNLYIITTRSGGRYTRSGFGAIWQRVQVKYAEQGGERFRWHDLRAKAGSETENAKMLGHQDERTFRRHYRRLPERVEPVRVKK